MNKKGVNPNRSLDPEQILFDCWADVFSLVWRRSGLRRELMRNKMPTRKWKRSGSYLLHNDLHYNGLMNDLGLVQYTANIINFRAESKCFPHFLETLFHFSSLFLGIFGAFRYVTFWCFDRKRDAAVLRQPSNVWFSGSSRGHIPFYARPVNRGSVLLGFLAQPR